MVLGCAAMAVSPSRRAASSTDCRDTLGPAWNTISVDTNRVSPAGGTPVKPRSPGSGRRGSSWRQVVTSRRCSATSRRRSNTLLVLAILLCTFLKFAALLFASRPVGVLPSGPLGPSLLSAALPVAVLPVPSLLFAALPVAVLPVASLLFAALPVAVLPVVSLLFAALPVPSLLFTALPVAAVPS